MDEIPYPNDFETKQPIAVPYLVNIPEVIKLKPGRQLFVDDYLLDPNKTTMGRVFHRPDKYTGNPVFLPESAEETEAQYPRCAVAKSGGVWFDDKDQLFKMWYLAGYLGYGALARSSDGIHWERPDLDVVPGTNLFLSKDLHPDSGSVIIDHDAKEDEPRYKMLMREPNPVGKNTFGALLFTSHDGVHWQAEGESGPMDDRSTMFYNPFRKKWVQSIRKYHPIALRARYYNEGDTFKESADWTLESMIPWMRADHLDDSRHAPAQLYNFDAIAYESIMIGFHQMLEGPENFVGEQVGLPKLTQLYFSTSRDGYHWDRPDRTPFIPARREYGSWEYGYVESSAGMCCIVGDELWFYYSAYAGEPERITKDWRTNGMYSNGAIGLAKLRRDGFASMRPGFPGSIAQTRLLEAEGAHLFVNASTIGSTLTVQLLDAENNPIPGFTHDDCLGMNGNRCCHEITWSNKTLNDLEQSTIRIQFKMDKGDLYAFWLTDSPEGKSSGYTAAGGPGFFGGRDS